MPEISGKFKHCTKLVLFTQGKTDYHLLMVVELIVCYLIMSPMTSSAMAYEVSVNFNLIKFVYLRMFMITVMLEIIIRVL